MPASSNNGVTTSAANTPQAADDRASGLENVKLVIDVMANDSGGAAKSLYSLHQTQVGAKAGEAVSALGAAIKIVNGKVEYFADGASTEHLAAGQTVVDTFTYAIQLGNGALSYATVQVTLTGTNDAPVVSGVVVGAASEDGASSTLNALAKASDIDDGAVLQVVGVPSSLPAGVTYDAATHSFTLNPADGAYQHLAAGQQQTVSVAYQVSDGAASTAAQVSWTVTGTNDAPVVSGAVVGSANEDAALATLNALANASDVDDGAALQVIGVPAALPAGVTYDAATHSFSLDASNSAYQHLAAGQTATVSVAYQVTDGVAATAASVSWSVTGTNDAPVVSGAVTGAAVEDGAASTLDALANASDVDDGAALQVVVPALLPEGVSYDAATHSFTLDASAAPYQSLGEGQTSVVSVGYGVSDGLATTAASLSWTVTGKNDVAVIGGLDDASVTEDEASPTLTASGQLSVIDLDAGQAAFKTAVVAGPGALGSLTLAADGTYTYAVSNAATQSLGAGQSHSDSFTVSSLDGTTQQVSFVVHGVNDAAVIGGLDDASVTEDEAATTLTASGQLSVTDADAGQAAFKTTVLAGAGNLGALTLAADGTYTYAVANAAVQSLNTGQIKTDTFTVSSLDGTTQQLSFTINGVDEQAAPASALKVGVVEWHPYSPSLTDGLNSLNVFSSVTRLGDQSGYVAPPSLQTLLTYDTVVLTTDGYGGASAQWGNALADYVDAGGHLIVTTFAFQEANVLGRLNTGGYLPGTYISNYETKTTAPLGSNELFHNLFDVNQITAYYRDEVTPSADAITIGSWADGRPLALLDGSGVLGLTVYPVPGVGSPASGDFLKLVANAVLYSEDHWSPSAGDWIGL